MRYLHSNSILCAVACIGVVNVFACSSIAADVRTWTDVTGKYRTKAEFVELNGNQVRLKKDNGRIIGVPLAKLSRVDQAYVRAMTKSDARVPRPEGRSVKAGPWDFEVLGVELLDSYAPNSDIRITAARGHKVAAIRMRCRPIRDYTASEIAIVKKSRTGKMALRLAEILAKDDKGPKLVIASPGFLLMCFEGERTVVDCHFIEVEEGNSSKGNIDKKEFWAVALGGEVVVRAFFSMSDTAKSAVLTFMPVYNDPDLDRTVAAELTLDAAGKMASLKYSTAAAVVKKYKTD